MAKAELEIIVKLKDMAKGAIKDLNTGLTGLGTGAAVAAGAGVAAVTAGLMNIGDQASNARTVLQGLNDVDLTAVLDDAQLLARRYGEDVNKTVAATRTLMEDFGLTSEEANDLIVSGFSRGLNASGDFLDSIGEYSNLFVDGGATAEEFFSLLESGLAGGVLGTDKAADAFKEFGIRLSELTTGEGDLVLKPVIGGEPGQVARRFVSDLEDALYFTDLTDEVKVNLYEGLQSGAIDTADAFKIIVPALAGIESEVERNAAGVQLFGTQWEDLGPQIMSQLTLTGTSMEQLGETAEAERGVILGSLGEVPALIFDKFSLALLPLSDLLLGVANSIMAAEDPLAQLFEEVFKLVPGLEQFAGQGTAIVAALQPLIKIVKDNLIPIIAGLVAVVGVALVAALVAVIAPIAKVILITSAFVAALFAAVAAGVKLYQHVTTTYPQLTRQIVRAFETAKEFVMTAMQVIGRVVQTITAALVSWWQANGARIIAQVQTTFNTAVAVVRSVMMQIEATVSTITRVIAAFWARYGNEIIATVSSLARQLGALWNDIYTLINAAMIGIGRVINTILREIQNYWRTNGQQIQDFAIGVFRYVSQQISAFMTVIRGVVQTITALIKGDWQGVANGLRTIVDGIYAGLVSTWNTIVRALTPIVNSLTQSITSAFTALSNSMNGTLTTIRNAIRDTFNAAINLALSPIDRLRSGVIDALLGIRHWLSQFNLGPVAMGIVDGLIRTMITAINNQVNRIKDAFTALIRGAINTFPAPIRDIIRDLLGLRSASATLPAPPPTTRGAAVGSVLPGASVTAGSSPSIVINIGSVRDARDIDAIKRAVRDGMDEAARRGIVQSQLPRGI